MSVAGYEAEMQAIEASGLKAALKEIRGYEADLRYYLTNDNFTTRALTDGFLGKTVL